MLRPTHQNDPRRWSVGPTLADLLTAAATEHPDAVAIWDDQVRLSYSSLHMMAKGFAATLQHGGFHAGDALVMQLPNWWEAVVVAWGTFLADGVLVPVVPIYRERELGFILDQVGPAVVVCPAEHRGFRHGDMVSRLMESSEPASRLITVRDAGGETDELMSSLGTAPAPLAASNRRSDLSDDRAVLVLYTSGTTADPKGVIHTHATIRAEVDEVARWCGLSGSDERVFMASPLSHITGLSYGIFLPAALGCTVVLQSIWDPAAAVDLIEESVSTFTVSATPFLRGLCEEYKRRSLKSALKTFVCGGADIPQTLVTTAQEVMGTRVLRTYGSTELPTATMTDPTLGTTPADEGRPMGGIEIRISPDEDGTPELCVRGPELFRGYLDASLNASCFTADGFFRTGDMAIVDDEGCMRVVGRLKDIINRGGEKFSVLEIESVLLEMADVADVAVVAYPDPVLVERACAVVVPDPKRQAPTLAEMRRHIVASGLAIQKAPEMVVAVEALPRTPAGKVKRFELRSMVRDRLPADADASIGAIDASA